MREVGQKTPASRILFMIAIPSRDSLTNDFYQEVRRGLEVQDSFSQMREAASARLAIIARDARTEAAGKIIGVVPQQEYLELAQKYGVECWDDRGFVRDFLKNEPDLKSANI